MLKILDKYIIKQYLSTFFFAMLIFSMISIIIDFSEKVEALVREPCTKQQIIFDYYLNFVLHMAGLLFPLYALITVIFFTSRLAYNSEIISILNAGVSFRRLLRPFLIASIFLTIIHLIGVHFVIPNGNKKRLLFEHTYVSKSQDKGKKENVHMFIAPKVKAYVKYYRPQDSVAREMRIERFNDKNEVEYILEAASAEWKGAPNKWRLNEYEIRTFDGMKETLLRRATTPLDTTFNIKPADFVRYHELKEELTTPELRAYIQQQKERGLESARSYEIEIYRRTADSFTILILTIIGMAIAARKVRGGMGLHLATGMGLGAAFIFLSKFSVTFATNPNVPPVLGVWIPNIVFIGVAAYLIKNAQK